MSQARPFPFDPRQFNFFERPSQDHIDLALDELEKIGAVTRTGRGAGAKVSATSFGRFLGDVSLCHYRCYNSNLT